MIITVTQFNNFVEAMLESEPLLADLQVRGELCNCRYSGSNVYFSLKDENCLLDCFAFSSIVSDELKDGTIAIVKGRPKYLKNGRFSFTALSIKTEDNCGELFKRFLILKEQLMSEGLFNDERKKTLPLFCFKVGIVTSVFGAVIEDIKNVVKRRCDYINLVVFPARVQGAEAVEDICAGIKYFSSSDVDVIIIARGGGSFEDLNTFNSEQVVRAVSGCAKPVISAVGHETDFTLCDFAADLRASTPSVAAELISAHNIKVYLKDSIDKISYLMSLKINNSLSFLHSISNDILGRVEQILSNEFNSFREITKLKREIIDKKLSEKENEFKFLREKIKANSPINILNKGYAVVRKSDKKIVTVKQIASGDKVEIILSDGIIDAVVE